jgi:hypothetical protein
MSIRKIQSKQAMPLSRYNNQLSFDIQNEGTPIDFSNSYLELEVDLPTLEDRHNLVLGQDGLYYPPTCFFRDSKMKENASGKSLYDLLYVNVLNANLEYWSHGSNKILSESIYSGMGKSFEGTNEIQSVFNNQYPDQYPTVKVPLSSLYPGGLGSSDNFIQSDTMEARFLLEPSLKLFQRAVKKGVYSNNDVRYGEEVDFDNVVADSLNLTPPETGIVDNYAVDDLIYITGNVGDGEGPLFADFLVVTEVVPDEIGVPGHLVLNKVLSATDDIAGVKVRKISLNPNGIQINMNNLQESNNNLEFTNVEEQKDIHVGTTIQVQYTKFDTATIAQGEINTIATITDITYDASGFPVSLVMDKTITLSVNEQALFISIVPLYTNVSSDWSLVNAHMVIYRDPVKATKPPSKLILNNFSSVNAQMVSGLNKFVYTAKAPVNTYNTYVMTPNSTNLYSFADTLRNYLISVDNVPLTTIYLDSQGSAVHVDNLNRVLSNSINFQPKNLRLHRDQEIISIEYPTMFPGKLYHSEVKGEPNLHDFNMPDKDLKIDIETEDGQVTPAKTVYIFMEKWAEV